MKRLITLIAAIFLFSPAWSQIIITSADMPVSGDTLRYSFASLTGIKIKPADSGVNQIWSYTLKFQSQNVDTYKTAFAVNPSYYFPAGPIGPSAYGCKITDTLAGFSSAQQVYSFFENNADSFVAMAFAATVTGIASADTYSSPDVWYRFPLTYLHTDSATYTLYDSVPGLGSIKQHGIRHTRVDGWGLISTPYYKSPAHCLRLRSIVQGMDTISISGATVSIPVNTVEYKWLVNGDHYPALWVTSNVAGGYETIISVRYRDIYRDTTTSTPVDTNVAVQRVDKPVDVINASPNPSVNGVVTLHLPQSWTSFYVQVFDMQSKEVATFTDKRELQLQALPTGTYIARVTSGIHVAYIRIIR